MVILTVLFISAAAAAEEPLNIMVVYAQGDTGVKAYVAAEDIKGAMIAAERINAEGGLLGRKVNIIDVRAVDNLQIRDEIPRLMKEHEIFAVVGANTSNITMITAPMFQEAGIPAVSPIATSPDVTMIGDYIFRACFTDPFQGRIMARFASQDLKAETAAILVKVNSKYSTSLAGVFKEAFQEAGEIVYEGQYLAEDVDFDAILSEVKKLKPDVVFVPGHGRDSGMIIKQAHSMGVKSIFLGGDGWGKGALGVAGPEAAEGYYFSNHWHMNVERAESREFVKKYTEKYGENMIAASAPLAYDSLMLIADATRNAKSFDRKKIRDALAETKVFQGVTGSITFDQNGDPVDKEAVILKYENGAIVFEKSVKP